MKSQKGMGHLMLIICIALILLIIVGIIYTLKETIEKEKFETYQIDMLVIQGKVKVISEEAVIQKNEELLKGRKLSESIEEEQIKKLLENNIISKEEISFEKYYILEKSHLEEMGLTNIELKEGYYIVNYDTDEIIYSEGIKKEGGIFYKLSELEKLEEEDIMLNENLNETV